MRNLLLLWILVSGHATASNWSIELHFYSRHFIETEKLEENEKNYGIGINYRFSDKWSFLAGTYRNSLTSIHIECGPSKEISPGLTGTDCESHKEYNYSRYVAVERSFITAGTYEIGMTAGVADGYKEYSNGFKDVTYEQSANGYLPMIGPYLNIGGDLSLKIRYMLAIASLGAEYKF